MGGGFAIVELSKGQLTTMNENNTQKVVETRVYRKLYQGFFERKVGGVVIKTNRVDPSLPNLQAVHTPYDLCHDMVSKLSEYSGSLSGKTILIFNLEFAEVMLYDEVGFGVEASQITFVTDCEEKFRYANRVQRYAGINVIQVSFNDMKEVELNMKFDVVIMNPPYQAKSDKSNTKTQAIWPEFVKIAFDICKKQGYVCAIHPSGWRDAYGMFKETQNILKSKNMKYLEMHDEKDGQETFHAITTYDAYVTQNQLNDGVTHIIDQHGKSANIDISSIDFIPNGMFDKINQLLAKQGDERVSIINNSSYHHQNEYVKSVQTDEFKYPCIYNVKISGPSLLWSNINSKGHFGVKKVIFNSSANGGTSVFVDNMGEYGICEFCSGIVDKEENLENIKRALDSKEFLDLMKCIKTGTALLNRKIIGLFRKDFWKEFI